MADLNANWIGQIDRQYEEEEIIEPIKGAVCGGAIWSVRQSEKWRILQTALCIWDWKFKHTAAYTQSNSVTGSLPTGHHKHLKDL